MLYYREYGNPEGQCVIFVHGGFTSGESFQKQFDMLPDCRLIFVDLPGYGKSGGAFSFERAAEETVRLIDALSPRRKVVLVAHSYGGLVIKQILRMAPEKVGKLVVGSTNLKRDFLFRAYTSVLGSLFLLLQNRDRYRRENLSWRLVLATQRSAWKHFDRPKLPANATIPCLFLYAEHDIRQIRQSMEIWAKKLTNSSVCEIRDAGHNYFWDNAEEVNSMLRRFIEGDASPAP